MKRIAILVVLTVGFFGAMAAPNVRADEWDKKTIVTFDEAVQVPGKVLPAGTYVFKLADTEGDRNIVQIYNADERHLITSVMAIPDYNGAPSDKTIVTFEERLAGEPEAIRTWFYPGDEFGQEFVYPKQKAVALAQANSRPVLAVEEQEAAPAAPAVAAITRVSYKAPLATPSAPESPAPVSSETAVAAEELPQTASPLGAIALVGVMFLAGATAVRRFVIASR